MKNLILTVAGESSRYPGVRPKFMLNHPNGNFMLIESIKGLDLSFFNNIYVVCLREHIEQYKFEYGLMKQFEELKINNVKITILNTKTKSQPHTVYECIIKNNINGLITIKDCDNYFKIDLIDDNYVSYSNLNETDNIINIKNKSYIRTNELGFITNIVEKNVISDNFCSGLYTFKDSNLYKEYYKKNEKIENLYLSHIIYDMMLHNINFKIQKSINYIDWGTLEDWYNYIDNYKTIFIDLDGVLVENSSEYFEPLWGTTNKIEKNVNLINKLYLSGKCKIIITTSRKKTYKEITLSQLKRENILYHEIIFDMNHNKRYLINDYSNSNPYPSSISINIKRNNDDLDIYLK